MTDIAFALAVLAVVGRHLPPALRTFLLTLAVVDDLLAITVIAVLFTTGLAPVPALLALVPLAGFGYLVQRGVRSWWLLVPLAVTTWALVHASGIHATVAGVLLGFAVPVLRTARTARTGGPAKGLAEHFEHRIRPLSSGFAVPVFAFFSAGVTVGGFGGLGTALSDRVAIGVVVGLVAGKVIGVLGATFVVNKLTPAELDDSLTGVDLLGMALLAGIGFTFSLLIGELAFGPGSVRDEHVKIDVLVGSVIAALLATLVLRVRDRHYR